jgi:hypothetical protein
VLATRDAQKGVELLEGHPGTRRIVRHDR